MKDGQKEKLRQQLIVEKDFFENLHTCSSPLKVRHTLNISSKHQLQLLAKIIHLVASGDIPLKRAQFDKIQKSKKLTFINNEFERVKDLEKLLTSKRPELISTLYKIQGIIPVLVSPLVSSND
jgi:hypothetical protein